MFVAARSQENRPMFSATSVLDLLQTLSYHLHHGFTKLRTCIIYTISHNTTQMDNILLF